MNDIPNNSNIIGKFVTVTTSTQYQTYKVYKMGFSTIRLSKTTLNYLTDQWVASTCDNKTKLVHLCRVNKDINTDLDIKIHDSCPECGTKVPVSILTVAKLMGLKI